MRAPRRRRQWVWHLSALAYRWTDLRVTRKADDDLVRFLHGRLSGSRVADCGCGPGSLTEKLARRGAVVIAVDANPSMVRQARARLAPLAAAGTVEVMYDFVDAGFFQRRCVSVDLVVFKRSLYAPPADSRRTIAAAAACVGPGGAVVVLHPERSLRLYAFGHPARPRRHSAFHLLNRCLSRLAARLGISDYRTYTEVELLDLLARACPGERVEAAATTQQAYNIAALLVGPRPQRVLGDDMPSGSGAS